MSQPMLDLDDDAVPAQANGRHYAPPESFETAPPIPAGSTPSDADNETEAALIGVLFVSPDEVLDQCAASGVTADSFQDGQCHALFGCAVRLRKRGAPFDQDLAAMELLKHRAFIAEPVWTAIGRIAKTSSTTAQAGYLIRKVRNAEMLRELQAIALRLKVAASSAEDPDEILADASERMDALRASAGRARSKPKPITAYRYPESNDPNILLGSDDYLGRGGGMLFVSHAGAGKSSWIMDGCMTWALGQPWMGIKPNGKLRSLIVQAEDSDRYIGKISASFAHVHSLDDETAHEVGERCQIVRVKGVSGHLFFNELRLLIAEVKPDLVVINPIYLYAEGDIGRSEFTQPFLLALDALNKDEKFAYILIHHTGKPQVKGKDGKRAEVEDWESAYMGFGSSYLANWPRCTALLEPVSGKTGSYMIKLGKGGLNAGVTKKVPQGAGFRDELTTRIAIKHSSRRLPTGKPVYFWEADTETEGVDSAEGETRRAGGRTKQYSIGQCTCFIPRSRETAQTRQVLYRYAKDMLGEISESTFRNVLNEAVDAKVAFRAMEGNGFVYWMNPQDGDPTPKAVPQVNF